MNDYVISQVIKRLGLLPVVHALRPMLALLNYRGFRELKSLTANLPLEPLLKRQPRFLYKYLVPYATAKFDRRTRLHVLINHYRYLIDHTNNAFFPAMTESPVLWRYRCGADECTISLTYPLHVSNEAELSLHFEWNDTLVQVVSFVIAPGAVVGAASEQVLLFGQVQGFTDAALLRNVTKALHDILPATLLVHAAYGIASALQLNGAAGVSKQNKAGKWVHRFFDYDAFWLSFKGELNAPTDVFLLPMPPTECPLEEVKRNHRARTLRKRQFKEDVRNDIAEFWQRNYGPAQCWNTEAPPQQAVAARGYLAMA